MLADKPSTERIPGYCSLCVSRCGSIASIENGRFIALEPNPSHPTGKALCAKNTLFCESQHRALPSLRRQSMDPEVELHPSAAAERGISAGDWVYIETPSGSVRARARLNDTLKPDVVCGQHGWWQACPDLDAPGYDPFASNGANFNLVIGNEAFDPISGSVPHRAYLCQIRRTV